MSLGKLRPRQLDGDAARHTRTPSYPLTSYLLTSYLPSYSEQNPNTAKNHPLRLSEQRPSRLLYGARLPITYRALAPRRIHPSIRLQVPGLAFIRYSSCRLIIFSLPYSLGDPLYSQNIPENIPTENLPHTLVEQKNGAFEGEKGSPNAFLRDLSARNLSRARNQQSAQLISCLDIINTK